MITIKEHNWVGIMVSFKEPIYPHSILPSGTKIFKGGHNEL